MDAAPCLVVRGMPPGLHTQISKLSLPYATFTYATFTPEEGDMALRQSSSPGPPHDESEEEELNTLDPILEEESESESTRPEEGDMALIKYRPPSKTRTD